VSKGTFRLPSASPPLLEIFSRGRARPGERRFTVAQIEQIRRTVRRVPEVMVKVTGGGRKSRAVAAHFAYISQQGELELETDDGQRVPKAGQKDLLKDWHLELSSGQYRSPPRGAKTPVPGVKLVQNNIVLEVSWAAAFAVRTPNSASEPNTKVTTGSRVTSKGNRGTRMHCQKAQKMHRPRSAAMVGRLSVTGIELSMLMVQSTGMKETGLALSSRVRRSSTPRPTTFSPVPPRCGRFRRR
jgi:hypothetical protein